MSAQDSLAGLMAAVQDGDQDAYRALLEALQPVVHRYVRKRIRSPEAAEDVSQEVLMTMHRVRHTYERARPFEPWLYSIARSRVIDHLRKERRLSGFEVMMDVLPEVADAGAETTAEQVFAILDKLPAAQREAFSMLKLEGLTTEEAAERAGVTVSALKVRAHRAYKALRTAFSREEQQ